MSIGSPWNFRMKIKGKFSEKTVSKGEVAKNPKAHTLVFAE